MWDNHAKALNSRRTKAEQCFVRGNSVPHRDVIINTDCWAGIRLTELMIKCDDPTIENMLESQTKKSPPGLSCACMLAASWPPDTKPLLLSPRVACLFAHG